MTVAHAPILSNLGSGAVHPRRCFFVPISLGDMKVDSIGTGSRNILSMPSIHLAERDSYMRSHALRIFGQHFVQEHFPLPDADCYEDCSLGLIDASDLTGFSELGCPDELADLQLRTPIVQLGVRDLPAFKFRESLFILVLLSIGLVLVGKGIGLCFLRVFAKLLKPGQLRRPPLPAFDVFVSPLE